MKKRCPLQFLEFTPSWRGCRLSRLSFFFFWNKPFRLRLRRSCIFRGWIISVYTIQMVQSKCLHAQQLFKHQASRTELQHLEDPDQQLSVFVKHHNKISPKQDHFKMLDLSVQSIIALLGPKWRVLKFLFPKSVTEFFPSSHKGKLPCWFSCSSEIRPGSCVWQGRVFWCHRHWIPSCGWLHLAPGAAFSLCSPKGHLHRQSEKSPRNLRYQQMAIFKAGDTFFFPNHHFGYPAVSFRGVYIPVECFFLGGGCSKQRKTRRSNGGIEFLRNPSIIGGFTMPPARHVMLEVVHWCCYWILEIPLQGQGGEVATWDVFGCQYHDMIAFLRAIFIWTERSLGSKCEMLKCFGLRMMPSC